MPSPDRHTHSRRRLAAAPILACAVALLALALAASSPAQDIQSQIDAKQSELSQAQDQKGVLTSEISQYADKIEQLSGEVAVLRNREAMVEDELKAKQQELDTEHDALVALRGRLHRSLNVLSNRLVGIYKSNEPDMLTVLLESNGFSDLVERFEFLQRIEQDDSEIVDRVRTLRNDTEDTVLKVRAARDEIAAKQAELQRTRVALEDQESELQAARDQRQELLSNVEDHIDTLEGDLGKLQDQVAQQLSGGVTALPAGPIQQGSGQFIWPVNGPITSPFGWRWGGSDFHPGIDIAVPEGTPIRAAGDGVTAIAAYTGGYGNYTCINHGGGLSTCYGHQSGYSTSVGEQVSQGEVIGFSGNTGSSTGPHVHFEVRLNGTPVDPMGYL